MHDWAEGDPAMMTGGWSTPESRRACAEGELVDVAPVKRARVRRLDASGDFRELGASEEFVLIRGRWYEVAWITSAPGLRSDQLEFE